MKVKIVRGYTQEELFDDEEENTRELDPITGFIPDTDQHIITLELMEGGDSRADIVERLEKILDSHTRRGNPKQVVNVVGNVIGKLLDRGWAIESHFKLIPPKSKNR